MEMANRGINSIVKSHLQKLPGGIFVTTPQDVMVGGPAAAAAAAPAAAPPQAGANPVGPNGQGIVTPKVQGKSIQSIMPIDGNRLVVPFTDNNGQLKTATIPPPSGLENSRDADNAVAILSRKHAEEINAIPLPDIKRLLRSQQGRQDTLSAGDLDFIENTTKSLATAVRNDNSNSNTRTINNNNSESKGRSTGLNRSEGVSSGQTNSLGTNDMNSNERGWNNGQGGGGNGAPSSSQSGGSSNKSGVTTGLENFFKNNSSIESSIRDTVESVASAGGSSSSSSQSGGGVTTTSNVSTELINNRNKVMEMLNANESMQLTGMLNDYANQVKQVTQGHNEMIAPYLAQQKMHRNVEKGPPANYGDVAASLFATPDLPQNFRAAVEPGNATNVKNYIKNIDVFQPNVRSAWASAVPDLYLATDKHMTRDSGYTALSQTQFPIVSAIINGSLAKMESYKNVGTDTTALIDSMNQFNTAKDLAYNNLQADGMHDGLAAMQANGKASMGKSVQAYNSALVLNALDNLTNISTMPTTRTPDGKPGPKQLIPFENFVNTVAKNVYDDPGNKSHWGPVAWEFMRSVPEYSRRIDELSKNQGDGQLWGSNPKDLALYYKLQGFVDWKNSDPLYNGKSEGIPTRRKF
jgi:hypothetical protein